LEKFEKGPRRRSVFLMFIPVIVLITVAVVLVGFYEREMSQVRVLTDIEIVGAVKDVKLLLTDGKSGLRSVQVYLVQGEKKVPVFEEEYPRQGLLQNSGPEQAEVQIKLEPAALKFINGEAELLVTIRDYSWWAWMEGNLATVSFPIELDTKPPLLYVADSPRYIIQGGAGVVTYSLDEEVSKHGVMINDTFHPGFPLPHKGEGVYGAIIGLEFNLERIVKSVAVAVDLAGNSIAKPFGMIMRKRTPKRDRINVSDGFLDRKLPEFMHYYPELQGKEPLAQYLEINNRVRQENNRIIREVCGESRPERLWEGRFRRMNGSSRAGFAEYRIYYYGEKEVDHQVHLGIDLASTRKAGVKAANSGVIVYADYLGIYGEMVIIDHGLGVFSLYSHLSQINVAVGDAVTKETVIGLTGTSGMAGGDHLHFSVLVNGVFVDPLEWWDKHWLNLHILNFL
jgi:murein DD-endopeptidase MepM/ murein hydrolase activator NlpD